MQGDIVETGICQELSGDKEEDDFEQINEAGVTTKIVDTEDILFDEIQNWDKGSSD